MSCRHLTRGAGRAPLWRLALCADCRRARRIDSLIGFALACRKAEAVPLEGALGRTLAELELPYSLPQPRRERTGQFFRRIRRPAAIVLAGTTLLGYAWLRYIDIDPRIAIPTHTVPHPSANDDFAAAAELRRGDRAIERMSSQLSRRLADEKQNEPAAAASGQEMLTTVTAAGAAIVGAPADGTAPAPPASDHVYSTAEIDDALRVNEPAIERARQGLRGLYTAPARRAYADTHEYMEGLVAIGRLFAFEAQVSAMHGKWDHAAEEALDGLEFGAKIQRRGDTYFQSIGHTCESRARRVLWSISERLSPREAKATAARLERIDGDLPTAADMLTEEKWFILSANLEQMKQPGWRRLLLGGNGGQFGIGIYLSTLPFSKSRIARMFEERMDATIARAQEPFNRRLDTTQEGHVYSYWDVLLPVYDHAKFRWLVDHTENRLLATTLALDAYDREHGSYPASLSFLAPRYLRQAPLDPFADRCGLTYRRMGTEYILYSVGPDGSDQSGNAINDPKNGGYGATSVQIQSVGDIVAGVNLD